MANIHIDKSGEEIRTCQGCFKRLMHHKGIWMCSMCGKDNVEHPLSHHKKHNHTYYQRIPSK